MKLGVYTLSRNRNLAAEGYRFFPSSVRPDLVIVAKPCNAGAYTADLVNSTCTCAAGRRGVKCCHLRESSTQVAESVRVVTIRTTAGFGSREAFEKARALDFD